MKKQSTLTRKMTSYSAMVAAALAGYTDSDAQILYTDVDPDSVTSNPGVYLLDLNNDGTTDFKFNLMVTTFGTGNQVRVIGYSNNSIVRDTSEWTGSWQLYQYADALNSGDLINAADSFEHQEILASDYINGGNFGDFQGAVGLFLGLKLVNNSTTYYGWARISIDSACSQLTTIDYAVDTVADEGILAGEKCGNYSALVNTIITPSDSVVFCAEGSVTLVTDSLGGFTYQWLMNNDSIPGANSFAHVTALTGSYSVIVTNSYGCVDTSGTVQVTEVPVPPAPVISQAGNTLESTAAAGYQWYMDGVLIPGATNQAYDPPQSGDYTVMITDENGCTNLSDPFTFIPVGIADMEGLPLTVIVSNNTVNIQLKNDAFLDGRLTIFNVVGAEIYSSRISSHNVTIEMMNWDRGVYLMSIVKDGNRFTTKMEVQ